MKVNLSRVLAAALLGLGCLAVLAAAYIPLHTEVSPPAVVRRNAASPRSAYPAESLGRAIAAGDLFRLGRRPADVAYDPARGSLAGPVPPGPPRPALRLVGIISGSPPAAIVDGLPGIEGGRVLRAGDTVGPLRVVSLSRNSVRIAGLDTVWTLTIGIR